MQSAFGKQKGSGGEGHFKINQPQCADYTILPNSILGKTYAEVVNISAAGTNTAKTNFFNICSGVVINSRVVLTAGHCVTGHNDPDVGPHLQYTVHVKNLPGAPYNVVGPAVLPNKPIFQTSTDSSTITLDGTGFAAATFNMTLQRIFPDGSQVPGICTGSNPNNPDHCAPEPPPGFPTTDAKGNPDPFPYCVPNDPAIGCCSTIKKGTCDLNQDVGILIFPPNSFPQHPCVSLASKSASGSSAVMTGTKFGADPNSNTNDGCSDVVNAGPMPFTDSCPFCDQVTNSCDPSGNGNSAGTAECFGRYPTIPWLIDYPTSEFCKEPFINFASPSACSTQCDPTFGILFPQLYMYCAGVLQPGDSGGPNFLSGTHTIYALNDLLDTTPPPPGGPFGFSWRIDGAVDTAPSGGSWVQNLINKYGAQAGCFKEN
jgi:hypothetical protein